MKRLFEDGEWDDVTVKNSETGNDIKISSALAYPEDHPAHKAAKAKIAKLDKKKQAQNKATNPYYKKYGKLKLSVVPDASIPQEDIKEDFSGDIHSHAVLKWFDPKTNTMRSAYTQKFLERNKKIKNKKVAKFTREMVSGWVEKCSKLMQAEDPTVRDSAAAIKLIALTGLRAGTELSLKKTGNRGVCTLLNKNVTVKGDDIFISFIGKSYVENTSKCKDAQLAKYITEKQKTGDPNALLFNNTSYTTTDKIYRKKIGKSGTTLKDMRTFTANTAADDELKNPELPPPPLPDDPKQIKKAIQAKLKIVFERVAKKLNNTPAMAKSSYVNPDIISDWIRSMGVEPKMIDKTLKEDEEISLTNIVNEITDNNIDELEQRMDPVDLGLCDEYPLPDWWDNDNIEFVPIKDQELYEKYS